MSTTSTPRGHCNFRQQRYNASGAAHVGPDFDYKKFAAIVAAKQAKAERTIDYDKLAAAIVTAKQAKAERAAEKLAVKECVAEKPAAIERAAEKCSTLATFIPSCWNNRCNGKCGKLHRGDDGWVDPKTKPCRNGDNCPTKDDPVSPCRFWHPSDEESANPVSHDDRKPKDLDRPLDWPSIRNAIGENSNQQKVTQEKLAETQKELAATQKKLAEMQSQFEVLRQGNIDLEERFESLYELTQGLINKVSQLDSEMNIVMVNQPIDDTDQLFAEAIQQDQDKNSQPDSTSDSA